MLKELTFALAVVIAAVMLAVMMPIMHAVTLYREWSWEGGRVS